MPSVDRLKKRLAHTLKARKLDAALGALQMLAKEEPTDPGWPKRAARLFRAQANKKGELSALRRALELQVDQGLVLDAIASCQGILALMPGDERTLETLDLLYLEGPAPLAPAPETRPPARSWIEPAEDSDAPLDSLVLTEVVPGARAMQIGDAAPGRVSEIPIDGGASFEDADAPDLHLEQWSTNGDLQDVAAAQVVCLPRGSANRGASTGTAGPRGTSLREELANIPLFGDLDPASLRMLIRRVRVVTLEPGQILFREGDPANSLYVVVEGAVVPIAEGTRRRKLAVLERGEFFGEIGLMAKQPRNATIEALVETKLLAIDRRVVWELIQEQPSVAAGILRFLRDRLIDRQIRTNLFFSAFVHAERESVARQFRFIEVEAGTPLVTQGSAPEGLFVVLSGSLSIIGRPVSKGDPPDKHLGSLGLGDVFGGLSLIDGRVAPADVVADSKCWLVVLGEGRFRRILEANPRLDRILRRIDEEAAGGARARSVIGL